MDSARTAAPPRPPSNHPQYHPTQPYAPHYASPAHPSPAQINTGPPQHSVASAPPPSAGPPHPDQRSHYPVTPVSAAAPPPPPPPLYTQSAHSYQHTPPAAQQYSHSHLPPIQQQHSQQSPISSQQAHPGQELGSQAYRPDGGRETEYQPQYAQHPQSGHATPVTQRPYLHELPPRPTSTPVQTGQPPGPVAPELHGAPKPPMEHAMHQGYPPPQNGVHHGAVPVYGPPQPPQHEHVTYSSTPVAEHHPGYGPPPPQAHAQMYPAYTGTVTQYSTAAAPAVKRRPMRAQQACEQCRQRKQKCDEGQPCTFCKEQSMECTYRDTPPAKTDKTQEKILNYLEQIVAAQDEAKTQLKDYEMRLAKLEKTEEEPEVKPDINGIATKQKVTHDRKRPRDHRTGPHKLIELWPTVASLFRGGPVPTSDYVANAENRGVLRIYGRGEGTEEQESTYNDTSPPGDDGSDAPTPREGLWGHGLKHSANSNAVRSTSKVAGFTSDGTLDLASETILSLWEAYLAHMHPMHPFLDRPRTRKLIDNFIARYSPDIQARRPASFVSAPSIYPGKSDSLETDRPGKRVRLSDDTPTSHSNSTSSDGLKSKIITEHSPSNAVVWLIMAVGKMCQSTEPLQGIAPERSPAPFALLGGSSGRYSSSPSNHNSRHLPQSPRSVPVGAGTPPDYTMSRGEHPRSRRSSHDSGVPVIPRNLDVVPGLGYYAKAAEILGQQSDGSDLVHAHMFILAALYKGQLARVKESQAWLYLAGRACQALVEQHQLLKPEILDLVSSWKNLPRDTQDSVWKVISDKTATRTAKLILMASWSTLQLESDILAEMAYPKSGISELEDFLIQPPGMPPDEDSSDQYAVDDRSQDDGITLMAYYSAQIFLRRRLNSLHRQLYGSQVSADPKEVLALVRSYESELEGWRQSLQPALQWDDSELPATSIIVARLRAKYYGALYVSTRYHLDFAINVQPRLRAGKTFEDAAVDGKGAPRGAVERLVLAAIASMPDDEIQRVAGTCVKAALHSTVALDRVGQTSEKGGSWIDSPRLIVTNIHGTAHAQFGNMLVLAATFQNKNTRALVPEDDFKQKLDRTIGFLRRLAPLSPTLALDLGHLERIQSRVFPPSDGSSDSMSTNNSFSMGSC